MLSTDFSLTPQFNTFGDLLRYLRSEVQLTQKQLADRLNYAPTYISRLENNNRIPNVIFVRTKFINALELTHEPRVAAYLIDLAVKAQARYQREGTLGHALNLMGV